MRQKKKPKKSREKKREREESREKRDAFPCSARFFFFFFFFFFYEFESDDVIEEERKVCAFFLCVFVFVLFVSFIIVNDKIRLEITTPSSSKTRREKKK
jgi:hypothetical protein